MPGRPEAPRPAALVSIPEAPAPAGAAESVEGHAGIPLRAALFPAAAPRGSVVINPGRTEPIEKYFEVIGELTARGFTVMAHDWRGQGLSHRLLDDRLAGHAGGWCDFVEDFRRLLAAFEGRLPRPRLALGHSMGGCLTLLALQEIPGCLDGAALSAPMLRILGAEPEWLVRQVARGAVIMGLGGRSAPGASRDPLEDDFASERLTHDEQRHRRFKAQLRAEPDLALGHPTWGWLSFALDASRLARDPDRLRWIDVPVAIVAAGRDRLVDRGACQAAAEALPRGCYVEASNAFHELLIESDDSRAVFWKAFDDLWATISAGTAPLAGERGARQSG